MTRNEFIQLIETYGSDELRWPEAHKAQMLDFISSNPAEAQTLLTDEAGLDAALESIRLQPGTDMLKARIMGALPQEAEEPLPVAANDRRQLGHKAVAALMLMAFTVGFGGASFLKLPTAIGDDTAIYASTDWEDIATDYGMDDVVEWVGVDAVP